MVQNENWGEWDIEKDIANRGLGWMYRLKSLLNKKILEHCDRASRWIWIGHMVGRGSYVIGGKRSH